MKTFIVKENNKLYRVAVRAAYQDTITSERELRDGVKRAFERQYGEGSSEGRRLFDMCSALGSLTYKAPIEK